MRKTLLLTFFIFIISACAAPAPAVTHTSTPAPARTPSPAASRAPTATDAPARGTITPYPTRRPTATIGPTKTASRPTPIPTSTRLAVLTSREPSIEELEAFLGIRFEQYPTETGMALNGDLKYGDVSGDGQADLVVNNPPDIFVLMWADDHYELSFSDHGNWHRGGPISSIFLDDWTNDGALEVVFDNTSLGGGSGWFIYDTVRKIIHCGETSCQIVWHDLIGIHDDLYAGGILERYQVETAPVIGENGVPMIRAFEEGFSINHLPEFVHDYRPAHFTDGLYVFTSTVTLYSWNGVTFEPAEEQIVSLAKTISSDLKTIATSLSDVPAEVIIRERLSMGFWRDNCQVMIGNAVLELQFPCSDKFTKIEWENVVGDNKEEVIVTTFSGLTFEQGYESTFGIQCQYQRILIFQQSGNTYTPIANVTGCIEESDLYGVRLEDVDGDGELEIRSRGNYWNGPELVYKYIGTEFVFWSELP